VGADPADAVSAASAGHIPASYRAGLRTEQIKGARIGVVRSLFGTAPEDQEVATVVNRALEALKKAGADVNDVVVPGLDDLLRDSSMIAFDFKFDLADYLARAEDPPVKSLGEILDRGMYHSALESTFRLRNAVESRDSDAARRARVKQTALRQALQAVLDEHRLVALVYPTLRRKPARIGEAQGGTNCQVSAHSGLPALGLPGGFTDDEVPIGMDLLGAAFDEQRLLSLGYSIEKTLALRRPPFSTPKLVDGKPPAAHTVTVSMPGAGPASQKGAIQPAVQFSYDETTARLSYSVAVDARVTDPIATVWLNSGTADKPGAARHLLYAGRGTAGVAILSAADRRDLHQGRLLVRFYPVSGRGVFDAPLALRW
jgi:amidase